MIRDVIALDKVSKCYDKQHAVDNVTLAIEGNTTTALIGPSGSGKSTLIRMINGLVICDTGTIRIDNEILNQDNLLEQRQAIGYVIQEGGLFPHLSAFENVALMPRYLCWSDDKLQTRIQQLAELVQITDKELGRYPAQLSGGQRQRISLMRALILDPKILLLDEPLAALDPMIRYELQQQLREIFRSLEKTVVIVTHDMSEATYFAEHIVLLQQGRVVQQGTFTELLQSPATSFVSDFIQAQKQPLQAFLELQE